MGPLGTAPSMQPSVPDQVQTQGKDQVQTQGRPAVDQAGPGSLLAMLAEQPGIVIVGGQGSDCSVEVLLPHMQEMTEGPPTNCKRASAAAVAAGGCVLTSRGRPMSVTRFEAGTYM